MKSKLQKEYLAALGPALLGGLGMSLYYFTDGLFIGNAVSDDGMSAITVAWNIVTFLTGLAMGVGLGGAIRFSVAAGEGHCGEARDYFVKTYRLMLGLSALLTAALLLFMRPILILLGGEGRALELAMEYMLPVVCGTVLQVFGYGALPLVRNMGGNRLASIAMGLGYAVNFVLDYVLMVLLPLGMTGCAIAYIAGQAVIALACALFLYKKRRGEWSRRETDGRRGAVGGILITGIAPFGLYFAQGLASTFISRGFMRAGGSEELAAYTTAIYIAGITNTLHRTIMDASQPLISRYYGESDRKAANYVGRWMFLSATLLLALGAAVGLGFKYPIARAFGLSEAVTRKAVGHLAGYLASFSCVCLSRTAISYLSAVDSRLFASLLTYTEPALMVLLTTVLPARFGTAGMWAAIHSVYVFMALLAGSILLAEAARARRQAGRQRLLRRCGDSAEL